RGQPRNTRNTRKKDRRRLKKEERLPESAELLVEFFFFLLLVFFCLFSVCSVYSVVALFCNAVIGSARPARAPTGTTLARGPGPPDSAREQTEPLPRWQSASPPDRPHARQSAHRRCATSSASTRHRGAAETLPARRTAPSP